VNQHRQRRRRQQLASEGVLNRQRLMIIVAAEFSGCYSQPDADFVLPEVRRLILPMKKRSRAAIVIGNSAYVESKLANPSRDATEIDKKLIDLNFKTIPSFDLDRGGLFDCLRRFQQEFKSVDAALLYYAGHGIQFKGKNYLLPVETKLRKWFDLNQYGVELDLFLTCLKQISRTTILLLDCCRSSPFLDDIAANTTASSRDLSPPLPGLAELKPPTGLFIAFATAPDKTAQDGSGEHSPFTQSLLAHMDKPNHPISSMMIDVRNDVIRATNNQQTPWVQDELLDPFVFNVVDETRDEIKDKERPVAEADWLLIQASNSIFVFEEFIRSHPKSNLRKYAQARIDEIRAASSVVQAFSQLKRPGDAAISVVPVPLPPLPKATPGEFRSTKKGPLGSQNLLDPQHLQRLINISMFSLAKIVLEDGRGIGSAFVVAKRDIFGAGADGLCIFTASHVVSSASSSGFSVPYGQIYVAFEGVTSQGYPLPPIPVSDVLWESPTDEFDTIILDIGRAMPYFAISLPIASDLPHFDPHSPLSRNTRPIVTSVSFPYGGGVKFGNVDNYLLDYERPAFDSDGRPVSWPIRLHYTAASEPGSSGCPILDENFEVVALHQGSSDRIARLNGVQGTYAANFGIWIQSIIIALRSGAGRFRK
jgi:hypothetical protein